MIRSTLRAPASSRRRMKVGAGVAVVVMVIAVAAPAFADNPDGPATETTSWPWPQGTYNGGGATNAFGSCNVAQQYDAGDWTAGYTIDLACQGMIPGAASVPVGPAILNAPTLEVCSWQTGGGYGCGSVSPDPTQDWGLFPPNSAGGGCGSDSGGDYCYGPPKCPWSDATDDFGNPYRDTAGLMEYDSFEGGQGTFGGSGVQESQGVACGPSDPSGPATTPSEYVHGSGTGGDADVVATVYWQQLGAPAEAYTADGTDEGAWRSVQFREAVYFPQISSLGHPLTEPDPNPNDWSGSATNISNGSVPNVTVPSWDGVHDTTTGNLWAVNYMSILPNTGATINQAAMPTTYFQGGSTDKTPCTETGQVVEPSSANLTAGQSYNYTFTYSSADYIVVNPDDMGAGTATVVELAANLPTYLADGGVAGHDDRSVWSDEVIVPATSSPQTLAMTPGYGISESQVGLQLWCNGTAVDVADQADLSNPAAPAGECSSAGCTSDVSTCFASVSYDALNPVSWVVGAVKDVACLLQWLFIPASVTTASLSNPITEHVPGLWVADAFDALGTLVGGANTALTGSDKCDAPSIGTGDLAALGHGLGGSSINATLPYPSDVGCGTEAGFTGTAGNLFGFRVVIRDVLAIGVYLLLLLAIWKMLPFSRRGDAVEQIGAAGQDADVPDGIIDYR